MELTKSQERSIRNNMAKLIQTRNIDGLLKKLSEYDVLDSSEIRQIELCSDDEASNNLLYEMILDKPAQAFDLLLFSLKDTDNDRLAQLLQDSSSLGDENVKRLRRQSSSDRCTKVETRSLSVSGAEMGIAEIFEDYPEFVESILNLVNTLKLKEYKINSSSGNQKFVMEATQILKQWTLTMKTKANVETLCRLLEENKVHNCAERIRRMFDNYIDSGFAFDFPGYFTITGKEAKIAQVLDDNPSFCLYPERLLLLLNLPTHSLSNFTRENAFIKNATKMLTEWTALNPDASSVDHLAALLALNGHFCTAEKVSYQ